jgi:NTE family protein
MTRVGLILGAGGVVGQAYHAGVLAALEHDLGWDPRTADLIVGSSAGSITGTLLRLGVPASDLAAWAVEAPISEEGAEVLDIVGTRDVDFPSLALTDLARLWRLPRPAFVARTARRPWALRPSVAAMTMLPAGRVDLLEEAATLGHLAEWEWPDDLWLCAVRRDDGGRVAFGRPGAAEAPLPMAIAASCAIPGYFRPVRIDDVEYFDGGTHTPTNADVVRNERLDVVVVVSPMSSARPAPGIDGLLRRRFHRLLMAEAKRLEAGGTTVVRFEPRRRTVAAMGVNAMANDRSDRVAQEAFLEVGRTLARPGVARRLRPLADVSARKGYRSIA